jgi:hypothetical protein
MKPFTYYILDENHKIIETNDIMVWGKFFEGIDNRRVAWTQRGPVQISTVFMGLDHNFEGTGGPVLFETMVFKSWKWDDYQKRYRTWEEAEEGHQATVKMVLGGWGGAVDLFLSDLLYLWNLIPRLGTYESWGDTLKWLFFIKR